MNDAPSSSERVRSSAFFLLAVGALKSAGGDTRKSLRSVETTSCPRRRDLATSALESSFGIPIQALIVGRRNNELHPDTGESGETYDVEALAHFDWNHLQ